VTCFHKPFDGRASPRHCKHAGRGVSVVQRQIRCWEDLRLEEQGNRTSVVTPMISHQGFFFG
jgi:hypothetical protein